MKYCYSLDDDRLKGMFELDIDWIERCNTTISGNYINGIDQMCKELFGNTGYLIYLEEYKPVKNQNLMVFLYSLV